VALDVAALEAALPATIILAVASAPAGLVSSGTQVYVSRTKRQTATSPEAWLRALDPIPVAGGLGHARRDFPYDLIIEKTNGTAAEMRGWRDALLTYFYGFARPFVTGLWSCRVEALVTDAHPGEGPAVAIRCRLVFREV
jgi:hypothetical protein